MKSDVYYDGFYVNALDGEKRPCKLLADEQDCVAVVCHRDFRYRIVFDAYHGTFNVYVDAFLDMDALKEQL